MNDFTSIEKVYRFAEDFASDYEIWDGLEHKREDPVQPWWRKITLASPLFASVQARRHPGWSPESLETLGITHLSTRRMKSHLHITHLTKLPESYQQVATSPDLTSTYSRYRDAEYGTMRTILSWIDHQTSGHTCHISNYRNLETPHFLQAPDLCPYCMALSLWYFQMQHKWHEFRTHLDPMRYPFMRQGHFYHFFDACEPFIHAPDLTKFDLPGKPTWSSDYATDNEFAQWFYSRGLQLSFLTILHACFDWLTRVRLLQSDGDLSSYHEADLDDVIQETLYLAPKDGEMFTFYYLHETPVEHYEPPNDMRTSTAHCEQYQRYLSLCDEVIENFDFSIEPSLFNQQIFRDLDKKFWIFIDLEAQTELRLDIGDVLLTPDDRSGVGDTSSNLTPHERFRRKLQEYRQRKANRSIN